MASANQATPQLSNSPPSGSSPLTISRPYDAALINTNDLKNHNKHSNNTINSNNNNISGFSSDDDGGGFVSGEEEFEPGSDTLVVETLGNGVGGENKGGVVVGSSEFSTPMTSMPLVDDDAEKGTEVRVLGGEVAILGKPEIGVDSVFSASSNLNQLVAEGDLGGGYVQKDGGEGILVRPEIGVEPISGEKSNLNQLVGGGDYVEKDGGESILGKPEIGVEAISGENLNSIQLVGDGDLGGDYVEKDGGEGILGKPEIRVEPISGENSNSNQLVEEGDFGVPQDGTGEVLEGSNGDMVVESSKFNEVVPEETNSKDEKLEEDKKSEALKAEDSVTVEVEESAVISRDSKQISDEIMEPANTGLVEADGMKFTNEGDFGVEAIHVNASEPGVVVVGEVEVNEDSEINVLKSPETGFVGLDNGSDEISHDVEDGDGTDFDKNVETSTNHSSEVARSDVLGWRESEPEADSEPKQNETVAKIAADGAELVSIKDEDGADGVELQARDFVAESTLSNQAHEAKHLEGDGPDGAYVNSLECGLAQRLGETSQVTFEAEDEDEEEDENHTDEEGDIEETDGIIFGSSEAAKQFMEELEQGSGAGSHSDQQQRIDGQIVTDSDEEVNTDEEGDGKELFDSAALTALLKAATGAGSDGGNITITSQDGSRLFSVERPAGLGSSVRGFKPATRPNRSNLFAGSELTTGEESENNLSEEEKKKLEKLQQIRVKFLRLVQRLGVSPDESVAAQVLYRLALAAGRQTSQIFSLDAAKRTAIELEAEGKDNLDFSVNILVLGKSGVGKSATINSIFGEDKSSIDAFERATTGVTEISGVVDGVKIKVFDTPGLKSAWMEQAFNRGVLSSIKKYTKKSPIDIVLYVDRLDTQTRDLNDLPLLKTITGSLGQSIWRSAIVTLTHAASAPPDGPSGSTLSYEVFVTQRSHVVQQSIGHAVGDLRMMSPSLMNPVSLVENHPLCRKNREGQKVLPNGQTWRPQLLLLCYSMKILTEASSLSKPQDPFDHRKLFGFRTRSPPLPYMLSSMLQTRAHPKLPTDQGMENFDSDVDLDDLSDSDQEEEEGKYEYDTLPPFKPLRKAQIAMLSKKQKKEYFEEYDYRLKLLRKKQWSEELKRMRVVKKKGKDGANEYGMGDDADQDDGSAAPVSTPLPDMVLPPSFDSDNPAYRYRFLEPTSQFLARPVLDTHGWDHDCGYDGVNLEQTLAIASQFPAAVSFQITKDKKDFSIHVDSSVSAKHGETGSSMAGFDIQTIGKQLAYIVRGETKFKNLKKNKTGAGISVTFLGENIATGLKIEDQIAWGKQWALSGSAGTVRCNGDAAYGANFELQRREKDYPIGQVQSTFGLSLIKWRGDWALGFNTVAQFSLGHSSKVALRAGINNKLSGQITVRTSSSEHLSLALAAIIPIANAIYRKIYPAAGDNYSIY